MKIHRFYIKDYVAKEKFKLIDKELAHQLTKVLRIKSGEQVIIFNGIENYDYLCKVSEISNKEICFTLIEKLEKSSEVKRVVNLYFAIPKSGVEDILRACSEIGADSFYPIITERTEKKDLNHERLVKIIVEASEQCGRNIIPIINYTQKLNDVSPFPKNSIAYHTKNTDPSPTPPHGRELGPLTSSPSIGEGAQRAEGVVSIFIGPEGGFTDSEIDYMAKCGAEIRNLNTYTLRTVTAAPVCLFDAMMRD